MKHTKGEWIKRQNGASFRITTVNNDNIAPNIYGSSFTEAAANVDLMIEAANVTNETGLSPRQLLEQRNELLEALQEMKMQIIQWDNQENGTIGKRWATKALTAIQKATNEVKEPIL